MNPILFGPGDAALFGVFEPAASDADRDHAVVLCPPLGHEYFRSHWFLRQTAQRLTCAGYSVLRFDYEGYGDSAGETGVGTPARWRENIAAAVDEALAASGARCVSVVGVRVACSLIASTALNDFEVDTAIMVDPLPGRQWLDELRTLQEIHEVRAEGRGIVRPGRPVDSGALEYMGSVFCNDAVSGLSAMTWENAEANRFRNVVQLCTSSDGPDEGLKRVAGHWGGEFLYVQRADVTHWTNVAHARGPALTHALPGEIVAALDRAPEVL